VPKDAPIAIWRVADHEALVGHDPCQESIALGSFRPGLDLSYESVVVKSFKECSPTVSHEPGIGTLCDFYAQLISEKTAQHHFDWIIRTLSSSEAAPDHVRPQQLLLRLLSARLGVADATGVFFRSQPRPPMRSVKRLSGPEALRDRLKFAAADLFAKPVSLKGDVLLLDDIRNTGASNRVYAWALQEVLGARSVWSVNLAQTLFGGRGASEGYPKLPVGRLEKLHLMRRVWVGSEGIRHLRQDCGRLGKPKALEMEFLAVERGQLCPTCWPSDSHSRRSVVGLLSWLRGFWGRP
jgi:hypothetical protein